MGACIGGEMDTLELDREGERPLRVVVGNGGARDIDRRCRLRSAR